MIFMKTELTILTQNLRTSGSQIGLRDERKNSISNLYRRSRRFKAMVQRWDPDVILSQEAQLGWIGFFEEDPYFTRQYEMLWKWRGPEGVIGGNQCCPLFFKKEKFVLLESGHFWLCDTPHQAAVSYEARGPYGRIVTWATLQDRKTKQVFTCYNAHVDAGGLTHVKSMKQFAQLFAASPEGTYAIVGGDINILYKDQRYHECICWDEMMDLQDIACNMAEAGLCTLGGLNGTSNRAWQTLEIDENAGHGQQRDHFFARHNPRLGVTYYGVDYNRYEAPEAGVELGHISDHYGVVAKVVLEGDDYSAYQFQRK